MTRGPWFAGKLNQDEWDIDYVTVGPFEADDHYEDTIAEVSGANHDAMANARLIAAAPDLLAACEKLVDYRRRAGSLGFQLEKCDDFIHMMKVAIAKATQPTTQPPRAEGE